jgi:hypothetical protein
MLKEFNRYYGVTEKEIIDKIDEIIKAVIELQEKEARREGT